MADWNSVQAMLDRFERDDNMHPADSEKLVAELFRACGHSVEQTGFVESDRGADLIIEIKIEGRRSALALRLNITAGRLMLRRFDSSWPFAVTA